LASGQKEVLARPPRVAKHCGQVAGRHK